MSADQLAAEVEDLKHALVLLQEDHQRELGRVASRNAKERDILLYQLEVAKKQQGREYQSSMETNLLIAQMKKQVQSQLANQLVANFKRTELAELRKFVKQQLFINQQSLLDDSKQIQLVMQKAAIIIGNLSLSSDAQQQRTVSQGLQIQRLEQEGILLRKTLKKAVSALRKGPIVMTLELRTKQQSLQAEFKEKLEAMRKYSETKLHNLLSKSLQVLTHLKNAHREQVAALERAHSQEVSEWEEEVAQREETIQQLKETHAQELGAVKRQFEEYKQDVDKQLEEIQSAHSTQLDSISTKLEQVGQEKEKQLVSTIDQVKSQLQEQLRQKVGEVEARMEDLKKAQAQELENFKKMHALIVEQTESRHRDSVEIMKDQQRATLSQVERRYQQLMSQSHSECETMKKQRDASQQASHERMLRVSHLETALKTEGAINQGLTEKVGSLLQRIKDFEAFKARVMTTVFRRIELSQVRSSFHLLERQAHKAQVRKMTALVSFKVDCVEALTKQTTRLQQLVQGAEEENKQQRFAFEKQEQSMNALLQKADLAAKARVFESKKLHKVIEGLKHQREKAEKERSALTLKLKETQQMLVEQRALSKRSIEDEATQPQRLLTSNYALPRNTLESQGKHRHSQSSTLVTQKKRPFRTGDFDLAGQKEESPDLLGQPSLQNDVSEFEKTIKSIGSFKGISITVEKKPSHGILHNLGQYSQRVPTKRVNDQTLIPVNKSITMRGLQLSQYLKNFNRTRAKSATKKKLKGFYPISRAGSPEGKSREIMRMGPFKDMSLKLEELKDCLQSNQVARQ